MSTAAAAAAAGVGGRRPGRGCRREGGCRALGEGEREGGVFLQGVCVCVCVCYDECA